MREVERYGIHMAEDWIDDENNEGDKLKVIRLKDREIGQYRPALWSSGKWERRLESPWACTGGYSQRDALSCDFNGEWGN